MSKDRPANMDKAQPKSTGGASAKQSYTTSMSTVAKVAGGSTQSTKGVSIKSPGNKAFKR